MSVDARQIWADYVLDEILQVPGLVGNGVVQVDTRPVFSKGDPNYRIPVIKDLVTISSSGDQRVTNASDMKLVPKVADGYNELGPVLFRGDAVADNWFEQTRTGEDTIARYGPQLGVYYDLQIQRTFISMLKGLFGTDTTAGILAANHQFGGGSFGLGAFTNPQPLVQGDVTDAKAQHSVGDDADGAGEELTILFVNPMVNSDVVKRTALVQALGDGTASSAYINGKVNKLGGAILIENSLLCKKITVNGTDVYPSYLMAVNAMYLGFMRSLETFTDQLPLQNGRQYLFSWLHAYCPHIYGTSWKGAVDGSIIINPERSDLEVTTYWEKKGRDAQIDVMRILNTLST